MADTIVKKKTHEIQVGDILVLTSSFTNNSNIEAHLYDSASKKKILGLVDSRKKKILFEIDDIDSEFLNDEVADLYADDAMEISHEHTKYSFYEVNNLLNKGFSIHIDGNVDMEWDVIENN